MPLQRNPDEADRWISILFTLSFSILLGLGVIAMAFANFYLGFVLFVLGLALVVGNEYLVFKRVSRKARLGMISSPTHTLEDLLNFAILAYLFPSAIALLLFFLHGWGTQVLVFAVAGFTLTSVKVAARTAQLFLSK